MSKEKLMAACVKIVSVNGCPISLIEIDGFQMLIDPIIKALEPDSAINCHNVRQKIIKVASDRHASVSKEEAGKTLMFEI